MSTLRVELSPKLIPVFAPSRGSVRYREMRGGRGSGKSYSAARMAAIYGAIEPLRILCTREYQNSIKDSMMAEIKGAISSCPWLSTQYDMGVDYIRHKNNGTEFIFKGLRNNISAVKSMAQIDICIVEEAETVPHSSWIDLIPTIRAPKSEIWIIYNPKSRDSWVAETFIINEPPPRTVSAVVNWDSNPWFSLELNEQRQHDQRVMDPALYAHVWEGAFYEQSEAQVFRDKYKVAEFEPDSSWDGPYFGLDFGFANDPTAATKSWVHDNTLYIEYDYAKVGLELDDTAPELTEALPDIQSHVVIADNARPESISYLKRHGLPRIEACKKGKGSVEDGISHIKSYSSVVIHPRCKAAINEFLLYSYKTDRLSGKVMPDLVDANNHNIDALRYSLEPIMKQNQMMGLMMHKRKRIR